MYNQLSYDARQISSQKTHKLLQRLTISVYEATKWLVNFIGQMVKVFLAK